MSIGTEPGRWPPPPRAPTAELVVVGVVAAFVLLIGVFVALVYFAPLSCACPGATPLGTAVAFGGAQVASGPYGNWTNFSVTDVGATNLVLGNLGFAFEDPSGRTIPVASDWRVVVDGPNG